MTDPAFCGRCGAPRVPGAAFCGACGAAFEAVAAQPAIVWTDASAAQAGTTCGRCGKPLSPVWRGKCNHCGGRYAEFAPVLPVSPPAVSKGRWFNLSDKQIAAVVIGGVLIFGWVGSRFGSPRAAPTERPAATVEAWSVPAGFTKVAGETIAYRWDETPNCSIADTCWGLEVVSKHGCPDGLYVELTTLTAGGDVVGYANDTVGSVRAGETAILSFDNFERDEGATKARIGEVSCR